VTDTSSQLNSIQEQDEDSVSSSQSEDSDCELERDDKGRVKVFSNLNTDEMHAYYTKKKATSKVWVLLIALKEALCSEENLKIRSNFLKKSFGEQVEKTRISVSEKEKLT
jgi:hypothetical protein